MPTTRANIPIGIPPGTRLLRVVRCVEEPIEIPQYVITKGVRRPSEWKSASYWLIWLHTTDFIHGTYLRLYDDGRIERVTTRVDEGDDVVNVKPRDMES